MEQTEHHVYLAEIVVLILALGSPVLTAFFVGAIIYCRRALKFGWSLALTSAALLTLTAFGLTFATLIALGFTGYHLPEPIFMIAGFINSPTLASCVVVALVVVAVRAVRTKARTAV